MAGAGRKRILIVAGPNGAGKTTFAMEYLPNEAGCPVFVNADAIAAALNPFGPLPIAAGRLMLARIREHTRMNESFAFETTLSGRGHARLIPRWQAQGYRVKLFFLCLPSVELAIQRVAARVSEGGHAVPEAAIRRRFHAGRRNFETLYRGLVDSWVVYDTSGHAPLLLDEGGRP